MRMVIELKREADPNVVLNQLYKQTALQSTFGVNMVALVDGVPKVLGLREVLRHYINHQREVVVRRAKYELAKLEREVHILEGQLVALDNLDAVIAVIRGSADRATARQELVAQFELTVIQADAILALRLRSSPRSRPTRSARRTREDGAHRLPARPPRRRAEGARGHQGGAHEIAGAYGDERRTQIADSEDEIDIEDLIREQQMVVTITQTGYIKSLPLDTYRQQHRGGRGVTGMDIKEGDYIEHLFVCSSHDYLLFFSNRGKIYRSKVYELPQQQRTSRGRALVNFLPCARASASSPCSRRATSPRAGTSCSPRARHGQEDRVPHLQHADQGRRHHRDQHPRRRRARRRAADVGRRRDPHGLAQGPGRALPRGRAAPMGRDTTGVRGMDVSGKDDAVLAMDVAREDQELLVVTENGYGKRTPIGEYRKTNRGTKGVGTIKLTEAKGALAGALVVREHYDLVFISVGGMVQRTGVRGINRYGRLSQGVRVMNMKADDRVSAVALVVETQADDPALAETVAGEGPIDLSADGGDADAGVSLPDEHAPDPSEMVSPEMAQAAESALDDGSGLTEPGRGRSRRDRRPPTPES
jgi:DNA gyrase subunit A